MTHNNEIALFVFIDALGWEIFSQSSFLKNEWVLAEPQDTILGYSCTCDPTILTGCMPSEHGHFSFFLEGENRSPFRAMKLLRCLPAALVNRGRVRRMLSKGVAAWHGFDGYFQLYETPFEYLHYFDYSEKRDIYQPGGIIGGQSTIFDHLRDNNVAFSLSNWRESEEANFRRLNHDILNRPIDFAYLYLAGLDGILHAEGTSSARAASHLAWYEDQLRITLQLAERQNREVRLFVFSDHGMTNVTRHLDVARHLASLPLEFGRDYVAYLDSTMCRLWFRNERAARLLGNLLHGLEGGRCLTDDELTANGVFFPDRRYGDMIFLCDPGVLICPSFMGTRPLAGMHGYDPKHADSKATFASNVSDVCVPGRLDEMFQVMIGEMHRGMRRQSPTRVGATA